MSLILETVRRGRGERVANTVTVTVTDANDVVWCRICECRTKTLKAAHTNHEL